MAPYNAIARLDEAAAVIDTEVADAELLTEALAVACRQERSVSDLIYLILARRHGGCL